MTSARAPSLVLCAALLAACGHVRPALEQGRLKDQLENPSGFRYLRVRGIGVAPASAATITAKRAAARQAALAAARKELLALVGGVRLTGEVTVRDGMTRDSLLRERVDRLVVGAEEALVEWNGVNDCVVTLQVRRSEVDRILKASSPEDSASPPPVTARPQPVHSAWFDSNSEWPRSGPLDLLMPGWAELVASGEDGVSQEASFGLFFRGLAVMAGVGVLAGVSGNELASGRARGSRQKVNLGWGLAAGALGLHVFGVLDANHTLNHRYDVALGSEDGGASFFLTRRF